MNLTNFLKNMASGTNKASSSELTEFEKLIEKFNKDIDKKNLSLKTTQKQREGILDTIAKIDNEINRLEKQNKRSNQKIIEEKFKDLENEIKLSEKLLEKEKRVKKELEDLNKDYEDSTKIFAKHLGKTNDELKSELNDFNDVLNKTPDNITNVNNQILQAFKKTGGFDEIYDAVDRISKALKGDLVDSIAYAINRVILINDKLIDNMRASGGVLTPNRLGFDKFGNNTINTRGSLDTITANNGLNTEEYLAATRTFSEGNIIGGVDINEAADAIQTFSVRSAKLSKVYGVAQDDLNGISQVLTQEYGKSISETTEILSDGAFIARNAGISVKTFFNNLKALTDMQNSLFIKNGAQGLEEAALALTKFKLNPQVFNDMNAQYDSFGSLVDYQQKLLAVGLTRASSSQERIFAKTKSGDFSGALRLREMAAAEDIKEKGFIRNGQITAPGLETLKAGGYSQEEIGAIRRIIVGADRAQASISDFVMEVNLSSKQLNLKRQNELEEMKITEKISKIAGQLNSLFIEPLKNIFGPITDIVLDGLIGAFDLLAIALKPITVTFKIIGKVLTYVANAFRDIVATISTFKEKIEALPFMGGGKSDRDEDRKMHPAMEAAMGMVGAAMISKGLSKFGRSPMVTNFGNKGLNMMGKIPGANKVGQAASGLYGAAKGLSPMAKMAGVGTLYGGMQLINNNLDEQISPEDKKRNNYQIAGSTAGGVIGGVGLPMLLGLVGSIAGPIGTMAGIAAGSALAPIVGSWAGAELGGIAGDKTYEWLDENFKGQSTEAIKEANKNLKIGQVGAVNNPMKQLNDIMNTKKSNNVSINEGIKQSAQAASGAPVVIVNAGVLQRSNVKAMTQGSR